ncbi:MAG: TonB-dependent receptor, partial [Saprospiraceae bacterium]|nr:TonB-dependent receptor [Saprospiraceae bacterium]
MPHIVSAATDSLTIEGTILGADRSPIVGAYILNTTADLHTHSTETGSFVLEGSSKDDIIKFMHLGYRTQELKASELLEGNLRIVLEEANYDLSEVLVGQNRQSVNIISRIDLAKAPVNSSQEVLRKVPGLFIGQHAGGGKAEQIFLRGFDIDHGTDISISVDGLPVNMVSHAHGQGYADLHFVIPETIEKIDFGKGPYNADRGNFATAGYVDFRLKEKVDESFIGLEAGQFNTFRNSALLNILNTENHSLYVAGEYLVSDGPFESPQDFRRTNIMLKHTTRFENLDKLSVLLSRFDSKWNASGQIPVRAVESGMINRFGAIDDTEGGKTSRTNVAFSYDKALSDHTLIKNRIWYSRYEFLLYSNFTFFLEDPINGDQIRQREKRDLFGVESELNHSFPFGSGLALVQAGIGLRNDLSRDNELARTLNRTDVLEPIQRGNIDEVNFYTYANLELEFGKWMINPGLRLDQLNFQYEDAL